MLLTARSSVAPVCPATPGSVRLPAARRWRTAAVLWSLAAGLGLQACATREAPVPLVGAERPLEVHPGVGHGARLPDQKAEPQQVSRTYLAPDRQLGEFAVVYSCAGREVVVGRVGLAVRVTVGPEQADLWPVVTASGERYGAEDDVQTQVVLQSDGLWLSWRGQVWPGCRVLQRLPSAFQAQGHRPDWTLRADVHGIQIDWAAQRRLPAEQEARALAPTQPLALAQPLAMDETGSGSTVQVVHAPCIDARSELPHPYRVNISRDGRTVQGCGGDTLDVLRGKSWRPVQATPQTAIQTAPQATPAEVRLHFGADGRLTGSTGCNTLSATYRLDGDFLRIQGVSSTRKACLGPVMAAERALLEVLPRVTRYALSARGELTLLTADGQASTWR